MIKKRFPVNIVILSIFTLFALSVAFYFFTQKRSETDMYVVVSLLKPENSQPNAPYNWVPYWISNSIDIGDSEVTPLGIINSTVIDKDVYEGPLSGQYVYITLQIKAIKDRNGIYLYKNKPILTNAEIELRLTKSQVKSSVIYIGRELPKYESKKMIITVKGREIEPWIAEDLKVGSTIQNSKGVTIAKVLDKKITPAEVRSDWAGVARISYDARKKDLEATVEITAQNISGINYFAVTNKVKTNEYIYLPFKEVSLYYPINSVTEVN